MFYHQAVYVVDLPLIDQRTNKKTRKAIEERLQTAPQDYGEPLRKSLKGYWKLHVGDYRIAFKIRRNRGMRSSESGTGNLSR